jgi:hypothetical protein
MKQGCRGKPGSAKGLGCLVMGSDQLYLDGTEPESARVFDSCGFESLK